MQTPASPLANSAIIDPWAAVEIGLPYGAFKKCYKGLRALNLGNKYSGNLASSTYESIVGITSVWTNCLTLSLIS